MFFTIEISRPIIWKPYVFNGKYTKRICWLLFAIGWHPMREDELIKMVEESTLEWRATPK